MAQNNNDHADSTHKDTTRRRVLRGVAVGTSLLAAGHGTSAVAAADSTDVSIQDTHSVSSRQTSQAAEATLDAAPAEALAAELESEGLSRAASDTSARRLSTAQHEIASSNPVVAAVPFHASETDPAEGVGVILSILVDDDGTQKAAGSLALSARREQRFGIFGGSDDLVLELSASDGSSVESIDQRRVGTQEANIDWSSWESVAETVGAESSAFAADRQNRAQIDDIIRQLCNQLIGIGFLCDIIADLLLDLIGGGGGLPFSSNDGGTVGELLADALPDDADEPADELTPIDLFEELFGL